MKKRKVTFLQAQKIQEEMCREGGLTLEETERVFNMCYEIRLTKKERNIIQKLVTLGKI